MRIVLVAIAAIVAVWLGAIQLTSDVATASGAARVSLPAGLSVEFAAFVAGIEPGPGQSQTMRIVLGTWAVENGSIEHATRFARSLRPGPDRDVLEGEIAQKRGDRTLAVAKFLDAGDLQRLDASTDALVAAHRIPDALALERALLAALHERHAQNDTIAEATYRTGLLAQARAYEFPAGNSERDVWQHTSLDAYERAYALAPLEDRYGIALGNQLLNVGDLPQARSTFSRVRDLDPSSPDPLTGLADAAIRARDYAAATAALDDAAKIAPSSPAIAQLRAKIPKP